MATSEAKQTEVDANFKAFGELLPELLQTHPGKFALLRHGKIVEFFDTARDAMVFGQRTYEDGLYSVQEVTQKVIEMGWFSYAAAHHPVRS